MYIEGVPAAVCVSDATPTKEELEAGTVVFSFIVDGKVVNEIEAPTTVTEYPATPEGEGVVYDVNEGLFMVCPEDNPMTHKGIWVAYGTPESIHADRMTFYFPSVTTGELKTIDPKFLPSGGGGNATLYFDLLSDDVYIYKTADLSEANRITVSELQEIAESGQSIVLKQTVSAELGGASIFMPVVSVTISPNAVGMCTVIQADVSDSGVQLIGKMYYTAEYTP